MVPFGRLLEQALRRKGLSQNQFARRVAVPRSVISEIVRGRRKPPVRRAVGWMDALDIPANERLSWRRAIALARADPILAVWLDELEAENQRLKP